MNVGYQTRMYYKNNHEVDTKCLYTYKDALGWLCGIGECFEFDLRENGHYDNTFLNDCLGKSQNPDELYWLCFTEEDIWRNYGGD